LRFQPQETALAIALELLSSHETGAPIVNDAGRFVGFVSEFDLLGAIESGQDLSKVTADRVMNRIITSLTNPPRLGTRFDS
jgi:CBS domain-containing protein